MYFFQRPRRQPPTFKSPWIHWGWTPAGGEDSRKSTTEAQNNNQQMKVTDGNFNNLNRETHSIRTQQNQAMIPFDSKDIPFSDSLSLLKMMLLKMRSSMN